jgi:hypothetical protein
LLLLGAARGGCGGGGAENRERVEHQLAVGVV